MRLHAERVAGRYLLAAAPYFVLPGRNRSTEYSALPGNVTQRLFEDHPVVYVQDEAGFVDPKKLAHDVNVGLTGRFVILSREAERRGSLMEAAALNQVAKEIERHLDVDVKPVVSPKTGKRGWKVSTSPKVADMRRKAEQMAWDQGGGY